MRVFVKPSVVWVNIHDHGLGRTGEISDRPSRERETYHSAITSEVIHEDLS